MTSIAGASALPAKADRDIVYSARYYLAPGSHGTSHFHIYRINPDGTGRKQITFGDCDDGFPRWSPDGKWIAFQRFPDVPEQSDTGIDCVTSASGSRVCNIGSFRAEDEFGSGQLQWMPDSRHVALLTKRSVKVWDIFRNVRTQTIDDVSKFMVSPNCLRVILADGGISVARIIHGSVIADRREITPGGEDVTWLSASVLAFDGQEPSTISTYDIDSATCETRRLKVGFKQDSRYVGPLDDGRVEISSVPHDTSRVVWLMDDSNSTIRPNYDLYWASTRTGLVTPLHTGEQFITFQPNGKRFLVAPGMNLANLYREKDWYGRQRNIWIAPLQLGKTATGKPLRITPGLVWVYGADWRGER